MARQPVNEADQRLKAIADHLGVPVSTFYGPQDPSLEDLRKAYVAAAEAYTRGLRRKARSVTLAGAA